MQTFDALDYLRLQVEIPTNPPNTHRNLIRNGSGEQGGYGWLTPQVGVISGGIGPTVRYTPVAGFSGRFSTETYPVTPGYYVTASWIIAGTGTNHLLAFIDWVNEDGEPYSAINDTPYETGTNTLPTVAGPLLVPPEAVAARVRFAVYGSIDPVTAPGADPVNVRSVRMACLPTDDEIIPAAMVGPSYAQILTSTSELKINRGSLNLGTLSATILDANLDPATASTLRPGREVLVTTTPSEITSTPEPLFTGKILEVDVTYDPTDNSDQATRIDLTAVDPGADLANVPRPDGVATIAELPAVLEGCRTPWVINGSTAQVPTAVTVSRNENASALDQVAITRDSTSSYAHIDRRGRLVAFDSAHWPALGADLDEDAYSDIAIGLGPCINTVRINWLRYNPNTGETEEIAYGPYVDRASVDEWGASEATFTLHGVSEETFDIPAFAAAVLAANRDRVVRATSATIPIRTPADIGTWGMVDLHDRHVVSNTAKALEQTSSLATIEHTITADEWNLRVEFDDPNQVASPQATPSPSAGGESLTIGELLRPVGEVTMWFGDSADIPVGWLRCDGSTFDDETYPDLAVLLGGTTLPNLVDRFPIGAGVKDLGTSGGSPTSVITQDRAFNTATTPGGEVRVELVESPLDVMPPWRALHFIIRAR